MHVSLIESKPSQSFCSPNLKSCVKKAFQGLGIASIVSGGILSSSARVSDHSKKTLAPIFFILGSLVLIASYKINYFKQFSNYWACQFLDRMEGTDDFLAPNELNIDGLVEHIVPSQRNVLKKSYLQSGQKGFLFMPRYLNLMWFILSITTPTLVSITL